MDINILQVEHHIKQLWKNKQIKKNDRVDALHTFEHLRTEVCSSSKQPNMQSTFEEFKTAQELYTFNGTKVLLVKSKAKEQQVVAKITEFPQNNTSASLHLAYQIYFYSKLHEANVSHLAKINNVFLSICNCTRLMQYACRGDITDYVSNPVNFADSFQEKMEKLKVVKNILWQIIKGLEEIHSLGFVIRDLKPSNILINHEGKVTLCDFGLVAPIGQIDPSTCGTPQYMSPQRLTSKRQILPINESIDLWALGILAYELIMGYTPYAYEQENISGLVESMYGGYISFDEQLPNYCKRFIFSLLQTNPNKRMSLQKAKDHEFFNDLQSRPLLGSRCKCNKSLKG